MVGIGEAAFAVVLAAEGAYGAEACQRFLEGGEEVPQLCLSLAGVAAQAAAYDADEPDGEG